MNEGEDEGDDDAVYEPKGVYIILSYNFLFSSHLFLLSEF